MRGVSLLSRAKLLSTGRRSSHLHHVHVRVHVHVHVHVRVHVRVRVHVHVGVHLHVRVHVYPQGASRATSVCIAAIREAAARGTENEGRAGTSPNDEPSSIVPTHVRVQLSLASEAYSLQQPTYRM